jgi:hypothetical protein
MGFWDFKEEDLSSSEIRMIYFKIKNLFCCI